jgi:hypothetical protein
MEKRFFFVIWDHTIQVPLTDLEITAALCPAAPPTRSFSGNYADNDH